MSFRPSGGYGRKISVNSLFILNYYIRVRVNNFMEDPSVSQNSQALLRCERCGTPVSQGNCYNSMGADPLILCDSCYGRVQKAWPAISEGTPARKKFIVDALSEGPATRRYLSVVPRLGESFRSLRNDGYSIEIGGDGKYHLTGSPESESFSRSLSACVGREDGEWLRRTYSDHWGWLCDAYCDSIGKPRTDDADALIKYSREENAVPGCLDRLSGSSEFAGSIRAEMREQVMVRLLDLVMAECRGVVALGPGKISFKCVEMSYGPIADESMIGEGSGFDCDILVADDSVECFADDDIIPFEEYFEQQGNGRVASMLGYMCGLRRRGIRWSPSSFR